MPSDARIGLFWLLVSLPSVGSVRASVDIGRRNDMGTIDAFDAMDDALSIRLLQKYPSDSDEGQAALRLSETAREARGLRAANKSLRERLEALREEIRRG